jgi:hypothetical protein
MSTWDMNEVKAALPADKNENAHGGVPIPSNNQPVSVTQVSETLDWEAKGWEKPEAYDYQADEATVGWEGNAVVYHWDGEEGDVGPQYPELELILFGSEEDRKENRGIDYSK